MQYIFATTVFFLVLLVFQLAYSLLRKQPARSVDRVIARYTTPVPAEQVVDILYYRRFSDIRLLDRVFKAVPLTGRLDELMQQGGVKTLAGIYITGSMFLAGAVYLLLATMLPPLYALPLALSSLLLPYLYLLYRRKERRGRFETLLPDALDLMCYSLKAGHSLTASFRMVAEEMAAPVGEEFGRVVDELNFGSDFNATMRNFARRVDSLELRFFATCVIIQRETGSNLVEMLQNIAEVIRRKFRFREKVAALSGEAKLSAIILVALPFVIGAFLFVLNPEYIMVLFNDPAGHYAIAVASLMMAFGVLVMYRLVQLDL